jgi:hypothetical protein
MCAVHCWRWRHCSGSRWFVTRFRLWELQLENRGLCPAVRPGDCGIRLVLLAKCHTTQPTNRALLWAVPPYKCVNRTGVNELTILSSQVLFPFPLAAFLKPLLPRMVALGVRVVVIVPVWQHAEWWPFVCTPAMVNCGKARHCMVTGKANFGHPFGPSYNLDQAVDMELQAEALNL